ncbi:MAG: hypothetical protein KDD10_10345, partial [Phaeodactylibacter sp.]|nr:hypothetical protein [Phaeodactylibacter sp.]
MKHWPLYVFCLLALSSCGTENKQQANTRQEQPAATATDPQAQQIVDAAIEKHGGSKYEDCRVKFDFRGRHYIATRQGAKFQYERIFTDTAGAEVRDVLTHDG